MDYRAKTMVQDKFYWNNLAIMYSSLILHRLVVINLYCPRADPERADREVFKLKFYKLLELRAAHFARKNYSVIILGDINTSHKEIDHCEPYEVHVNKLFIIDKK